MICPSCKNSNLFGKELPSGLHVAECGSCGGYWLKSFQYWNWIRFHNRNLPEKQPESNVDLAAPERSKSLVCPECGATLTRRHVGHGTDFNLDRCGNCRGIWFDCTVACSVPIFCPSVRGVSPGPVP